MEQPANARIIALAGMPEAAVLTRLGYRKDKIGEHALEKYRSIIAETIADSKIRIIYRECLVESTAEALWIEKHPVHSGLVRRRTTNATSVFLIGALAMPEEIKKLHDLQKQNQLQQAVILDSVLSEKVDYGLDFLEKELTIELRRTGRHLGSRISCGYGDFDLSHQEFFYQQLGLHNYGISINDRYILTPEKIVTALVPVFTSRMENE